MSFRVGQKVVFVGGKKEKPLYGCPSADRLFALTKGAVYTIRDLDVIAGIRAVRLAEVYNEPGNFYRGREEPWYYLSSFRPAQDISSLESIVADVFSGKKREIKGKNPLDRKHKIVAGLREAIEHARSLRK